MYSICVWDTIFGPIQKYYFIDRMLLDSQEILNLNIN